MGNIHKKIKERELLEDMKETASNVEGKLSQEKYSKQGEHGLSTVKDRFRSWNNAKQKAGLEITEVSSKPFQGDKTEEEALANLKEKLNAKR